MLDGDFKLDTDRQVREFVEVINPAMAVDNRIAQAAYALQSLHPRKSIQLQKIRPVENNGHRNLSPLSAKSPALFLNAHLRLQSSMPGTKGNSSEEHTSELQSPC